MARVVLLAELLAATAALHSWRTFPNANDVDGCGMTCSNATPFQCVGTFSTPDACAAHAAATQLPLYVWSASTRHCWTRTDGAWAPVAASGDVSGCNDAVVAGCAPPPPPPRVRNVTISVGVARIARTHPLHPAVALDFWRADDPRFGEKWMNSSALTIDLASPALIAAATALAPAVLRLGGSPEDSLVFDDDGSCVPQSGGNGPFAPYFCSQVHPYTYDCLTRARWFSLLEFAASTGLRIAFGLNGCWGRASREAPMNRSNAEALFAATAASPHAEAGFWGFELSNEVVPSVELTARQCLSGGDYELLQRNNSFAPNPDYWIVYLFRALVGGAADVFNVTASAPSDSGVRVFAFSAASATRATRALLALNLQVDTPVSIALSGTADAAARLEFHLTAPDLDAAHGDVACNGRTLAMDPATHAPPAWSALGTPAAAGSPLVLAPASIAFVLLE